MRHYPKGKTLKTKTVTATRDSLAATLDSVIDDREEVIITRPGKGDVVLVAREDYESLKETAHLLQNPANARRLLSAIERLEAGNGSVRDLVDEQPM